MLRATINGRRRDIGLGPLDLVTLAEARELAIDMRRDIQRGIDPIEERKRQKIEILTFKAAAEKSTPSKRRPGKTGSIRISGSIHSKPMLFPSSATGS